MGLNYLQLIFSVLTLIMSIELTLIMQDGLK